MAGIGTKSGLMNSNRRVPTMPTAEESAKPGFDRSIRYQSTGFATARVIET